jgi:uncharacterized membrane protein
MLFRLLLIGALAAGFTFAQDEGGGGGGGGGGRGSGGGGGSVMSAVPRPSASALDKMVTACNLSKDQRKQFKTILDAASKSAEALRKQIPQSRTQMGAAIQAGKSADEIKKLEEANGLMAAQMAEMEYKAFGELYKILDEDQHKAGGGQRLFGQVSGLLMKKNWDE